MTLLLAASAAPTIHVPHVDYLSILPMLIMLGGALALMLVSSILRRVLDVRSGTIIAVTVSVAALVSALFQWQHVASHGPQVTNEPNIWEQDNQSFAIDDEDENEINIDDSHLNNNNNTFSSDAMESAADEQ